MAEMEASEPPTRKQKTQVEPRAFFPVMSEEELSPLLVPYAITDGFTGELTQVLGQHGVAVVTGVLGKDELAEFEELWRREFSGPSAQPKKELPRTWWANSWLHVQGEFAWKGRLHPRVRDVFQRIFGTADLSCGLDLIKNFCVPEGAPAADNEQWLHVDQNTLTGITHRCYQGVLYLWPSGEGSSTTVVWPGSHKEDGVYGRLVRDPQAQEKAAWVDEAGVPFGHYIKMTDLRGEGARELERAAVDGSRRVPVPAGALLLWDSRTAHQGWSGGSRLAVPVCWEPRGRVGAPARRRKLFLAAAGLPSTHSPSEGRVHPCVATRRGPGARMGRPAARPFAAKAPEELPEAAWEGVWASWGGERFVEELVGTWEPAALERVLKPEIASVL